MFSHFSNHLCLCPHTSKCSYRKVLYSINTKGLRFFLQRSCFWPIRVCLYEKCGFYSSGRKNFPFLILQYIEINNNSKYRKITSKHSEIERELNKFVVAVSPNWESICWALLSKQSNPVYAHSLAFTVENNRFLPFGFANST